MLAEGDRAPEGGTLILGMHHSKGDKKDLRFIGVLGMHMVLGIPFM
jgi:hypothetical protein